jgi:hypothetical protein
MWVLLGFDRCFGRYLLSSVVTTTVPAWNRER